MSLTHEQLKEFQDKAYNSGFDTRLKGADDMLFAWITQWDDTYLSETDLGYRSSGFEAGGMHGRCRSQAVLYR